MKKSKFLLPILPFLLFMESFAPLQAQNGTPEAKTVRTQPAVQTGKKLELGRLMDRSLYASVPAQLQWNADPEKPVFFYVEGDSLKMVRLQGRKTAETLLTLDDLNRDPVMEQHEKLKTFPRLVKAGNNRLYLHCGHIGLVYDIHKKKISFHASLPENATNFDAETKTGQMVFTRANNLYLMQEQMRFAISRDPDTGIVNGQVVHRNEFGIAKGTFWSNTKKRVAYYVMDESMVQQYPITSFLSDPTRVDPIRYPEAGNTMHKVKIGVFNTETYENLFLEPYADPSRTYITGITWSPDDREIYTVVLDRNQKDLTVVCYDAANGKIKRKVFEEHHDIYVEPEMSLVFRPGHPDQFIWMSERSGFNHMYLYNTAGECLKAITPADEPWMITSFTGFSRDGKSAYFMATKESPLQNNLYSVNIDNGKITRLTREDGVHQVRMHSSGLYFIDIWSSPQMARRTQIINNKGNIIKVLREEKDPMAGYVSPQFRILNIKAADGKTDLYARMILPPDFDSTRKYPVIVYVYGGPHAQLITESYNYACGTFLRFLAQEGYIVWTVDSRGSANRGFAFETAIHRHVGDHESADQMCGVEYLKSLPYVDAGRIGVDGWSYGGFMTLTLKTRYPDVFKVATAGGPVIDWKWYEVMYGERYMGTPQDNPEGYETANLLNRTDSIRGKVMLIQGGLDPVVLPKHSTTFVQKCIQKNIPIDFFVYPNHEHNVTGPERDHLFRKIYDYYRTNL